MARRTSTRSGRGSGTRQAKATSRKAATTEVEVVEEAEDGNIDSTIVMLTTVLLVAAILMMDKLLSAYDAGTFFS